MIKVALTQGQVTMVDDVDAEVLDGAKWYAQYSPKTRSFYAQGNAKVNGQWAKWIMHRVITGAQAGQLVDHKNHDTSVQRAGSTTSAPITTPRTRRRHGPTSSVNASLRSSGLKHT